MCVVGGVKVVPLGGDVAVEPPAPLGGDVAVGLVAPMVTRVHEQVNIIARTHICISIFSVAVPILVPAHGLHSNAVSVSWHSSV